MIMDTTRVSGRAAILAATGDHPYARLNTGGDDLSGYLLDGATAWIAPGPHGKLAGYAMGDPLPAARLFGELIAGGTVTDLRWLNLPPVDAAVLARYLAVEARNDWYFHWTAAPPPVQPGEEDVVRLTTADHPAIEALLDDAFPSTGTRPDDPRVRRWYGIRSGDRLVACGADRGRGSAGMLAAITVARDSQGSGLGAAVTAAMTRALLAEAEEVTLGVLVANERADRLYRRLGFAGAYGRTSVRLA